MRSIRLYKNTQNRSKIESVVDPPGFLHYYRSTTAAVKKALNMLYKARFSGGLNRTILELKFFFICRFT